MTTDLFYNPACKGKWYGIEEIDFYFYNTTVDPEICYDGKFYNAVEVECTMYYDYEEGGNTENYTSFAEYMRTHKDDIFELLENLKSMGEYHLKPWNYRK